MRRAGGLLDSGRFQSLAVGAFFLLAFLGVRLVFYTYVTEHWLGSLGVITGILLAVLALARAGRMGWLGRAIVRKISEIPGSRKAWYLIAANASAAYLMSYVLVGLAFDPGAGQLAGGLGDLTDPARRGEFAREALGVPPWRYAEGLAAMLALPYADFGAYVQVVHALDAATRGWSTHFAIVSLVETAEATALLCYFKFARRAPPRPGGARECSRRDLNPGSLP